LRSAWRDTSDDDSAARLRAIAATCQRLAREPDFEFLYHRKRRLFHIGFRVTEHQLDAGFYDLLASEARATSLWAIAKGDVPAAHWAALGRPFFAAGDLAGLRSWSGSMFEYLMPTLVLDEPHGSVLHSAAHAAVQEQIAHGRRHHVPWGISESAYAGSDHTLAYQYAPQGVPTLALRRTPVDELVVAPYATALAAQVAPHRAAANLRRMERIRARGRYGFIEALDYSPARQSGTEGLARVETFMAHHQGMSVSRSPTCCWRARRAAGACAIRASRRWRRCCTSAHRGKCRCCTKRRQARRPRGCRSAARACCAMSCPAWRRSSQRTCSRTAVTPSRCVPTAPAPAAGDATW
jgi:cyclic beta-1,2-glucan synthetase